MSSNLASPTIPLHAAAPAGVIPAQGIARMLTEGAITTVRAAGAGPGPAGEPRPAPRPRGLPGPRLLPARRARRSPIGCTTSRCTASTSPAAPCSRRAASTSCRWSRAWRCPTDISAVANAKSSTGRLDLFTRLITDRGTRVRPDRGRLRRPALRRDLAALVLGAGPSGHAAEPDPLPPRARGRRRRRPPPARRPGAAGQRRGAHRRRPRLLGRPRRAPAASSATAPSRTPA